jgi:hypothetical protein
MLTVDVPEFRAMPVLVVKVKKAPTVKVLDPMFKVRVLELLDAKLPDTVKLKLLVVNVPLVRVQLLALNASAKVTVIPTPLIVVELKVLLLDVIVPLARKSACIFV